MDRFGDVPIHRIDFALAETLVTDLCEERLAIERASKRGAPLMETVANTRTGRTHRARRRGISNSSIRKALDASERVLRDASRRGLLPGGVPDLKSAAPRPDRINRSFLEIEQIAAFHSSPLRTFRTRVSDTPSSRASETVDLSDARMSATLSQVRPRCRASISSAARRTGEPGPRNRNDVPRRVIIEVLLFAGLRVAELCGLSGHDVSVAAERIRVPRSATKTDAGERAIPMVRALRDHLVVHQLRERTSGAGPAFPTRNGTRQNPDNVRSRIVAPLRIRANELLEAEGRAPIAHFTPHTLRRTFASILALCDVPPRRAMYLMGHTNASLTLAVYQHVLDGGRGATETLEGCLGCTIAEARAVFTGDALVN